METVTLTKPKPLPKLSASSSGKGLKIIPLGGLGEIGKNMLILEYGNDIIVIDCGIMFPPEEMLGIDFVIPDIRYLEERKEKLKGIIITHGHEDHIGALPYLWKKLNVPIWTTKLTAGLIEVKMEEFNISGLPINLIKPGDKIKLGVFEIEFFRVNHSIPDCVGLVIDTPEGLVVHTGDFKFDHSPANPKEKTDIGFLANLAKRKVLLLLSDSTNAEVPGYTPSETEVAEALDNIIGSAPGRVIITSFASLINRIQQVINAAVKHHRKVAISGRTMIDNINIALKLGYLSVPKDVLIDIRDVKKYGDDELIILVTGSQGEERSALVLMAGGEHKAVKIKPGDTVIISSSMIPGNERSIYNTIDNLYRLGAEVIYSRNSGLLNIHVSGHAAQEELKMMIELVKPKYFIPIHGEYHHLYNHAKIAVQTGLDSSKVFVIENGQQVLFSQGRGQILPSRVPAGYVLVDGSGVGDVGNIVLRDRQAMAKEGILVAIMTVDAKSGKLLTSPDIISRGFIYMREREDLVEMTRQKIKELLSHYSYQHPANWPLIKTLIRKDLGEFLYRHTKRKPMVIPVIIEV